MRFTKMHGCGNDYVYVDCTVNDIENPNDLAIRVSDRHFAIGSDGLILIRPSEVADFKMSMFNADGSEGKMCGNGIRCVAKYVYDKGLTDKDVITIETLSGIKTLKLNVEDGKVATVRVNMGAPILEAKNIPTALDTVDTLINYPLEVDGIRYFTNMVSMGNPHCIIFTDEDVRGMELEKIGPGFEKNPFFPEQTNTEFANVLDRTHIRMRVWERGSGETLACGTGACATTVAAVLNGLVEDTVDMELLGGHLTITYDRDENTVYMTGPATISFEGEIDV